MSAPYIERFLRTGDETWEGASSDRFTLADINQDEIYTKAAKTALRRLFDLLAEMLPTEALSVPPVNPEATRQRVEAMVKGLVQRDWQDVALRELTRRTFVLNFPGAKAAMAAELSTCYLGAAWQILWAYYEDHGLKADEIKIKCDGVSAGEFAHVRWSAHDGNDPYSDVIVHEAAHLLHYLKPEHYGLAVRRGVRGGGRGYHFGGPRFAELSPRLSLFSDHLRTVLAVKGSLRRAQQRRALDGSGPF